MKMYGKWRLIPHNLNLSTVSTPKESAPVTHWIGSWEEPRDSLDAVTKRKISASSEKYFNHAGHIQVTTLTDVPK
jgi:hypothetical protein